MKTKINLKILEENSEFPTEFIDWFVEKYGDKTVNVWEVIDYLKAYKIWNIPMYQLFEHFKLSGSYEDWYNIDQLHCKGNFKNGERYGKWEWWHGNGQLEWVENYKENGELIKTIV